MHLRGISARVAAREGEMHTERWQVQHGSTNRHWAHTAPAAAGTAAAATRAAGTNRGAAAAAWAAGLATTASDRIFTGWSIRCWEMAIGTCLRVLLLLLLPLGLLGRVGSGITTSSTTSSLVLSSWPAVIAAAAVCMCALTISASFDVSVAAAAVAAAAAHLRLLGWANQQLQRARCNLHIHKCFAYQRATAVRGRVSI